MVLPAYLCLVVLLSGQSFGMLKNNKKPDPRHQGKNQTGWA